MNIFLQWAILRLLMMQCFWRYCNGDIPAAQRPHRHNITQVCSKILYIIISGSTPFRIHNHPAKSAVHMWGLNNRPVVLHSNYSTFECMWECVTSPEWKFFTFTVFQHTSLKNWEWTDDEAILYYLEPHLLKCETTSTKKIIYIDWEMARVSALDYGHEWAIFAHNT